MDDVRAAGGGEISDESEAARLHGAVKGHLRLHYLYLFLRCWDTASDAAAAELQDLVAAEIIPLYGGNHPVGNAIANALPTLFYALSVQGMPFDSSGIERVFNSLLRAFKNAHVQVQSEWAMTVSEEVLTFIGMCERNGIDPCNGLDMLLDCPDWFAGGGGGCGCAASSRHYHDGGGGGVRRVQPYKPTGPGPPAHLLRPLAAAAP